MRTKLQQLTKLSSKEKIKALIQNGVTCFRVNLSHGTKSEKSKCFDLISFCKLASIRPTILADLAGPKIRVNRLERSIKIRKGSKFTLAVKKNQ